MIAEAHRPRTRGTRRLALCAVLSLAFVAPAIGAPVDAGAATPGHARTATEARIAAAVLKELNHERAVNHLPALKSNPQLLVAARTHNAAMAKAQQLSHQLPGEAVFSTRITKAGYRWRAVAENVGQSAPGNTAAVIALQKAMYAEKAPNDPHRKNILSRSYNEIGLDVYLDPAHGRVWLTQDFGHR